MASESSDTQADSYSIRRKVSLIGAGFFKRSAFLFCMFQLKVLPSNFLCRHFLSWDILSSSVPLY